MKQALELHRAGDLAGAESLYRQIAQIDSQHLDALTNLSILLQHRGALSEAESVLRRIVALVPESAEASDWLGRLMGMQGCHVDAAAAFRSAIALDPTHANAWCNLGNSLLELDQVEEAEQACRRALAADEKHVTALLNLCVALQRQNKFPEALVVCDRAIALAPQTPLLHFNRGYLLGQLGQREAAVAELTSAMELQPDFPKAYISLAEQHQQLRQYEEMARVARRALEINPQHAAAHNKLGFACHQQGLPEEALGHFYRAVELEPTSAAMHSDYLLALHYVTELSPQQIFHEHLEFARRHANVPPTSAHKQDPAQSHKRLRIGYMSADFRFHPVLFFIEPLIERRDRTEFEVFCYSDVAVPSDATQRFERAADHFRCIAGMSDARVVDTVIADQIDILIDLSGHTGHNRLAGVFARKPAPVQITYFGYPNTTGLSQIDYRITDAHADPPGLAEQIHSEKLIRLPHSAWCYRPPPDAPPIQARRSSEIVFGSFNNLGKLTSHWRDIWSQILQATPGSRILLRNPSLTDPGVCQRVRESFAKLSIPLERLILMGHGTNREMLDTYNQVDIALDSYPYHGTTTTCEALFMSVPVITLAGPSHVSRVSASLLANVGLPELIADTEQQFVTLVVDLAQGRERLLELHNTLRQRMQGSPAMNEVEFTRAFEAALRDAWINWCTRTPAPEQR